jgi:hypothetical protein
VVGVASYLLIRSWYLHRALFFVALILFSFGFISLVLGLLDKGPLRGLIYQFTVLYRADYMHAGIAMLLHNPLTGVGIDSYDDWYRAERGIISALRTSLNRTANSAHNISIDLAAGGGFPLLIAYLLILGVISLAILKGLRSGLAKDPVFMALSMSWFAYQVQASVSINQIGVGVWGWILGGALLGYTKIEDLNKADGLISNSGKKSKREKKSQRGSPNTPPPISVVSSATLLAIGFTLAFLPLKTDADFATAAKSGSAEKLLEITSRPNINTFFLAKAASDSVQSNLPDIGKSITTRLTTNFPRTLIGHLITYDNPASSPSERDAALAAITRIDPFVAFCYSADSAVLFRRALDELSSVEKYKLARGWGFSGQLPQDEAEEYSFEKVPSDELLIKIRSFCGY